MVYKFFFSAGINNSYFFETTDGIIYEIRFKPTPYLFHQEKSEISKSIFEFSILVEYNPKNKLPSTEKKIGETVVAIFLDFYKKNGDPISIYICDSSDGKELIRKRKFDNWFVEFNDENFIKIDETLIDHDNNKFPISLILSKSNPYRIEIIEAFIQIAINNNKN